MTFLVDFENVHSSGLSGITKLSEKDSVIILFPYSLCNEVLHALSNLQVKAIVQLHCVSTGYKDALDFKLLIKALLVYKNGENILVFVSNDTIYHVLHDALVEFGYLGIVQICFAENCETIHTIWDFSCGEFKILTSVTGEVYKLVDGHLVRCSEEYLVCRKQDEVYHFASLKLKGVDLSNLSLLHQYVNQLKNLLPSDSLKNKLYHEKECVSVPAEPDTSRAEPGLNVKPTIDRTLTALKWEKAISRFKSSFIPSHKILFKQATKNSIKTLEKMLFLKPAKERTFHTLVHLSSYYLDCNEKMLEKELVSFWEDAI